MVNKPLEESEEIILSKYFDDECTANERVKAEQLLRSSESAVQFLDGMRAINTRVNSHTTIQPSKIDQQRFWSKISARIEQEERLSIIVGERSETSVQHQIISEAKEKVAWFSGIATWVKESFVVGGLSGAVATAALLIFLAPFGTNSNPVSGNSGQSVSNFGSSAAVSPVTFSSGLNSGSTINNIRSNNVLAGRNPMEVDWMRGNGRVTIIQGSPANSPIIWVRRKDNANQGLMKQNPLNPLNQNTNTFMSR